MNIADPTSLDQFRQVGKHLRQGGTIITGIDRPLPNPTHRPRFFGRPAALSTHYVQIAAWAHAPIVVIAAFARRNGTLQVETSEPIEMDSCPDRETETLCNAEKVLAVAEGFILRAPTQWSMTWPVWPAIKK